MTTALLKRLEKLEREIGNDAPPLTPVQEAMMKAFNSLTIGGPRLNRADATAEAAQIVGISLAEATDIMGSPAIHAEQLAFWDRMFAYIAKNGRRFHDPD